MIKPCAGGFEVIEAAYIAGFIDGEGTISIQGKTYPQTGRYTNAKRRYRGLVSITNSDLETMRWIVDWFNARNIKCSLRFEHRRQGHLLMGRIHVAGIKRVYDLLQIIKPYLRTKRKNAAIVEEFCCLRLKKGRGRGKNCYGIEEIGLINRLEHVRGFNVVNGERVKVIGHDS